MGNAGSTIASNTIQNITNSMTSIVNNTAMQCTNEFASTQNATIVVFNTDNVEIKQNLTAQVGTECVSNVNTISDASTMMYQEIGQIAEAIMQGGKGVASASNVTQLVTNLATTIVNTFTAECANTFTANQSLKVLSVTSNNNNYINLPEKPEDGISTPGDILTEGNSMYVEQNQDINFIGTCLMNNTNVLSAATDLQTIIEQYAKAEQTSILGLIALLVIATAILFFVIFYFGSKLTKTNMIMILGLIFGIILIFGGFVFFIGWIMTDYFGEPETEYRKVSPYDQGKWQDVNEENGPGFSCDRSTLITRIGGFTSCVAVDGLMKPEGDIKYPEPYSKDSTDLVGTYSMSCANDSWDFGGLGLEPGYYSANPNFLYAPNGSNDWNNANNKYSKESLDKLIEDGKLKDWLVNYKELEQGFLNVNSVAKPGLCCEYSEDSKYSVDINNPYQCVSIDQFYSTAWQKESYNKNKVSEPTLDRQTGGYIEPDAYYGPVYDNGVEINLSWSDLGSNLDNENYNACIVDGELTQDENCIALFETTIKNYMRTVIVRQDNTSEGNQNGIYNESIYNAYWYGRDGVLRTEKEPSSLKVENPKYSFKTPTENLRSYSCWDNNLISINKAVVNGETIESVKFYTSDINLDGINIKGTRQCVQKSEEYNDPSLGFNCIEYKVNGGYKPSMCCRKEVPTIGSNTKCIYNEPLGDPYTCKPGALTSFCDYCLNYNESFFGANEPAYQDKISNAAKLCYRYAYPTAQQMNKNYLNVNPSELSSVQPERQLPQSRRPF